MKQYIKTLIIKSAALILCLSLSNINTSAQVTVVDVNPSQSMNDCTGSVVIEVTGTAGPFTYYWIDPNGKKFTSTSPSLDEMCFGTYTLTVFNNYTDCGQTVDINIGLCTSNVSIDATVNNNCPNAIGMPTGSIAVYPSGGSSFQYLWNTGQTTSSIYQLPNGNYTVTVTEGNTGCKSSKTFTIESELQVEADINESCPNNNSGAIQLQVNGGNPPYSYYWNTDGINVNPYTIVQASPGTHAVTITDANGCYYTDYFIVGNKPLPQISATVNKTCYNSDNGSIIISATEPYNYAWSTGENNTAQIVGLEEGTYCVTVSNNEGCVKVECFDVEAYPELSLDISTINTCPQANEGSITVNVIGGTSPYTYDFNSPVVTSPSNSHTLHNLPAVTNHSIQVTDGNGCIVSGSFTIDESVQLVEEDFNTYTECGTRYYCNGDEVPHLSEEGEITLEPNPNFCQYVDRVCSTTGAVMEANVAFADDLEYKRNYQNCEVEVYCKDAEFPFITYEGYTTTSITQGSAEPGWQPDNAISINGTYYWCERITTCYVSGFAENDYQDISYEFDRQWILRNRTVNIYDDLCGCNCTIQYIFCDENGNSTYDEGIDELLNSFKNCVDPGLSPNPGNGHDNPKTRLNNNSNFVKSIYPNPFTDYINIEFSSSQEEQIHVEIYDILNQRVFEKRFSIARGEQNINIKLPKELPEGIYQININDSKQNQSSHKMIHIK